MNSFYSVSELSNMNFASIGNNVQISRFARFYSPEKIHIGDNVRIDDFCILSGEIILGNFIHISAYSALYGRFGIEMEDFTGLSPRCTVFSATDDFNGDFLVGPMVSKEKSNIIGGKVLIKKYSQIGVASVLMPGIIVNEGVAVGAMSFVNKSLDEWTIYAGNPIRKIKERSKGLLKYIDNE